VVAGALARGGSAWHRTSIVPQLASGAITAAWALDEASWLWNSREQGVRIDVCTDGSVEISGSVPYVVDAASADLALVAGRSGESAAQVTVPLDAPGVHLVPFDTLDLTRQVSRVVLETVRQPAEAVLLAGDISRQFDLMSLLHSVESVGAADRVFEFTLQYAKERVAFGRPIGSYQAIKHRLADLLVSLESCKATVGAAIRAAEADSPDTSHLVSVAAAYVGETASGLIQECVQIHGGIGLTWEHDIHLYLRRVTTNRVMYGTSTDHRRRLDALLSPL
jgi:alkylation response protein AidB-like acyl-CoA dehydrogenase